MKSLESSITTTAADARRRQKEEADRIGAQLADAKASRDAVDSAASQERQAALQRLRSERTAEMLRTHRLTASSVHGVGRVFVTRLRAVGIASAADFTGIRTVTGSYYGTHSNAGAEIKLQSGRWVSVQGIGTSKASALDSWRRTHLRAIEPRLPNSLPAGEAQGIEARYQQRLRELDARTKEARNRSKRETERLKAEAEASSARLKAELGDAKGELQRQKAPFRKPIARAEREVSMRRDAVDEQRAKLRRYDRVTFPEYVRKVAGLR